MKFRRITALLIVLAMLAVFPVNVFAVQTPNVIGSGACVMDAQTGEIIFEKNADQLMSTASLAKVMTVFLVYDAIASGRITKDTVVPISKSVSDFSRDRVYSNVTLNQNTKYTVDEMLDIVIVYSACAATNALGELIAGSQSNCVKMMNAKAKELGLNAVFADCYGGSADNRITPRSMTKLTYLLEKQYPDYLKYSAKKSAYFHGANYSNRNEFILGKYSCDAVIDGVKSGFTSAAGYCLVLSGVNNGNRVITTVMKSTENGRNPDSRTLMNYGVAWITDMLRQGYQYIAPSSASIRVDGKVSSLPALLVDGTNYVRLRDVAQILNGTGSQFEVSYDSATTSITLFPKTRYTSVGGELSPGPSGTIMAKSHSQTVRSGQEQKTLEAYLVSDTNYVKLRDLAAAAGFAVDYDEASRQVIIGEGKQETVQPVNPTPTPTPTPDPTPAPVKPATGSFNDVLPQDWYYSAVEYVKSKSIMNGVSDTEFEPMIMLNRAMLVQILYNLEGRPAPADRTGFPDVHPDDWYFDAINWSKDKSIVNGFEDGKFRPLEMLTREQAAAILYRYSQYKGYDVSTKGDLSMFRDQSSVGEWAWTEVAWAVERNLFFDDASGYFRSYDNLTRAETAYTLTNYDIWYSRNS